MKKFPKAQLDEIIKLTRKFQDMSHSDEDTGTVLNDRIKVAQHIGIETGIFWSYILDFVDACIGLNHGCTNEDIYRVLEVLGWTVTDDGEEA